MGRSHRSLTCNKLLEADHIVIEGRWLVDSTIKLPGCKKCVDSLSCLRFTPTDEKLPPLYQIREDEIYQVGPSNGVHTRKTDTIGRPLDLLGRRDRHRCLDQRRSTQQENLHIHDLLAGSL